MRAQRSSRQLWTIDDVTGGSDLPARMDRNEPAEDRLRFCLHESRLGDHRLETLHVGKAPDRFDQIAIAVLVMRDELADLGHDAMRISVIDIPESRPESGREFEAEEAPAALEHAMCLAKRLGNVGDVADAEGDRDRIEALVGEAQRLGIFDSPVQAGNSLALGTLLADVEHRRID